MQQAQLGNAVKNNLWTTDEDEHPDVEEEETNDILECNFEKILMKIEEKGRKTNIFKFNEM